MPRIVTLVTLVALLGAAPACSDSGDPGADPTTSPTASTATTTPTEPTEPTESTSSEAAATGPILDKMPLASVRAPEGWRVLDQLVSAQQEATDGRTGSILALAETENFSGQVISLDELADIGARPDRFSKPPKVLPHAELDGVEVYHLAGQVERTTYLEEFGVATEDVVVTLEFQFNPEYSAAERQDVVDAVVASFLWK